MNTRNFDLDTTVNLAGVELKNPVMTASGTFGSGEEYSEFVDLNRLGAVVTKGVAKDVPVCITYLPSGAAVSMFTPGATRDGFKVPPTSAPRPEKSA